MRVALRPREIAFILHESPSVHVKPVNSLIYPRRTRYRRSHRRTRFLS